jgi:SAM-dependent methyltransferase
VAYDKRGLSFGEVAEQYDEFRPGPPPEAVELFGDLEGLDVLEVGAGTGKWTRLLVSMGANVTVVEPDDEMRAVLERQSPNVHAVQGAAEALPVADAAFDTALVSSAWHWFEQPDAAIEFARALRDGARLFVLWNGFSRSVPWIAELTELRERPDDAQKRPRGWSAEFPSDVPFDVEGHVEINWTWTRTIDEMVSLFGTYSGAIIRSDDDRLAMEVELRRRLEHLSVDDVVHVPMTVRGTIARRRPRD